MDKIKVVLFLAHPVYHVRLVIMTTLITFHVLHALILSSIYVSLYLSVCLCMSLYVCMSVSVYVYMCLSVCLGVYLVLLVIMSTLIISRVLRALLTPSFSQSMLGA